MFIEDGFEYNLKQALKESMDCFESKEEFMKAADQGDDDIAFAIWDRAAVYTDLSKLAEDIWDKNK